jgi:CHAD domain-containing protein
MAYRFKKDEAFSHAIERVFAEEITGAVGQLVRSKNREQAIHEARKSLKKIRGLVSLVEPQLGSAYKMEDRFFCDAGRLLADLRDGAVIVQVFDHVAAQHPELPTAARTVIRHGLERSASMTSPEKEVSSQVVRLLNAASLRVRVWPLQDLPWQSLVASMESAYRRSRRALKHAQKLETSESLHNFRKKVKQHWYHLRLFENFGYAGLQKRLADLDHLSTELGNQHNLIVLRSRLTADLETSHDRQQIRDVLSWLDEESDILRKHALEAGQRLFAEKPIAFRHRFSVTLAVPARKPTAVVPLRAKSAVA